MPPLRRRVLIALLAPALAATTVSLSTTTAAAISPDVVISEVYGGGGNSGATYKNDFIELYNAGTAAVDLSGWSVQYASSSGPTYQVTQLAGDIRPGEHFLVQEAAGSGGTQELPAPDAFGSIAMSGTAGKVALVTSASMLTCGADCDSAAGVRDFVGYGTANDSETSPAPATTNTTSVSRTPTGSDTDNNSVDFTVGPPAPQNTGRPPVVASIHEIQGAAQRSPLENQRVSGVTGVVTETTSNGFWMQDPVADEDPATSEGIFVFSGSGATPPAVGTAVTVGGTVTEFRPGGSSGSDNLTTTELTNPTVQPGATGAPLPAPTVVGYDDGERTPPGTVIEDDANGDVEAQQAFDPGEDGIDFWESMEGMRVNVDEAQVVGPTNRFNEVPVVPAGATVRTVRGGIVIRSDDFNPERVLLDTLGSLAMPAADVGDSTDDALGVLDYSFGNFHLLVSTAPTFVDGGLTRESTDPAGGEELAVATFNVENLDPSDSATKFDALADIIVDNLQAPDVLALEEVQDNNGATNDDTVAADQTLDQLVAAITSAGGPTYDWRQINPVDDQDGGEPGGNIRVAFLFRTDRGLAFVDRPGGGATKPTQVLGQGRETHLSSSPGRVAPNDPAWEATRKPLVGEFTWNHQTVFVIANHFSSKGGDDPLFGRTQPPVRSSEPKRHQQAQVVRDFVAELLEADPSARIAVAGDVNDFQFSRTTDILVGEGATALTDLPRTLPVNEQYTYVFEGNSQVLDHILVSRQLVEDGYEYDIVHVNAEFADQVSDHDPQVVRLAIDEPSVTALTLDAEPLRLRYLSRDVRLTGQLSNATDDAVVTLQQRPAGSEQWSGVDRTTVGSDGSYAFSARPDRNTDYRVIFAGGPDDLAASSGAVTVTVAPAITIHASSRAVAVDQRIRFTGSVSPRHAGDEVGLQRLGDSGWRTVSTDQLNRYSEYRLRFIPHRRGGYVFRVHKEADADHVAGASRRVTVGVS